MLHIYSLPSDTFFFEDLLSKNDGFPQNTRFRGEKDDILTFRGSSTGMPARCWDRGPDDITSSRFCSLICNGTKHTVTYSNNPNKWTQTFCQESG